MSAEDPLVAPQCVVFDVDDTLYLERDYVRSGFDAVGVWAAAELEVDGLGAAAWERFLAGRRGDVFDAVLQDLGIDPSPATIDAMVECYRSHRPRISVLSDAAALIERLHGQIALAAVTDGPLDSQRTKVEVLGVARWSELVVLTGEFGPGFGKPHPQRVRARGSTLRQPRR